MTTITIDPYVNSYGVRVYDSKDGYQVNETQDERLEALKIIARYVHQEIQKEMELRQLAAGSTL